jgi:hypothetical protein
MLANSVEVRTCLPILLTLGATALGPGSSFPSLDAPSTCKGAEARTVHTTSCSERHERDSDAIERLD